MKKTYIVLLISIFLQGCLSLNYDNPVCISLGIQKPQLYSPSDSSVNQSITPLFIWNSVEHATGYRLQLSTSEAFSSYVIDESEIKDTLKQAGGIMNDTLYYWRVSASNDQEISEWSDIWNFRTIGTVPGIPVLLTPANEATGQETTLSLSWNASSGATSYTLQVSVSNSFTGFVYNQSGLTSTSQQVSGLSNSTTYYWRVSATSTQGTSAWSSVWSFITIGTVPGVPTLVSPTNGATGQATTLSLSWNTSSGATSYTLQVSPNNSFTSFVYNQSGLTSTSQQVSGLNNSTTYYWRVSATNTQGTSGWSSVWSFITIGTAPAAPTLISQINGATCVAIPSTLSWNASNDATSYTLQVSTNNTFSNYVYNQSGLTSTSQQVSGLSDSTIYYWRVSATNNNGTSSWSSMWSFTTGVIMNVTCTGTPTVTYSGKTYNTVQIGNQCWLKENLDVGTMINSMQNATNNGIIEKYCYDDNAANCNTYGGLYQWNEVMQYSTTPGTKGICPTGWHIPTNAELQVLAEAVCNKSNALKSIGQGSGSGQGTNTSGFSALLAGYRYNDGFFYYLGNQADFWSSTEISSNLAYIRHLYSTGSSIALEIDYKGLGFSARCAKDF